MPTSQPATKRPSVRQIKRAAGIKEPRSAIVLLKADHREVEGLFKDFQGCDSAAEKQAIAKKICAALRTHMRIEEEVFYPAFIEATGSNKIHNEAVVEHQGAKNLIAEIEGSAAGDPLFEARVTVLSDMIKHHVKEEERFNGMFTKARLARMDLRALGILLEARKQELARGAAKSRTKAAPPSTRAAFVSAAALARSKTPRPHARRTP